MQSIALVAGFGALGALARYWVSGWAYDLLGTRFAYGTLAVNLIGCFLIGGLMHFAVERSAISAELRTALGIGLLGGFTTFSTFGYETFAFVQEKRWLAAGANIAANVVLGLACVWAGAALAAWLYGK